MEDFKIPDLKRAICKTYRNILRYRRPMDWLEEMVHFCLSRFRIKRRLHPPCSGCRRVFALPHLVRTFTHTSAASALPQCSSLEPISTNTANGGYGRGFEQRIEGMRRTELFVSLITLRRRSSSRNDNSDESSELTQRDSYFSLWEGPAIISVLRHREITA